MTSFPTLAKFPFQTTYAVATRDEFVGAAGATDEVFEWMSVTKPLSALAALVAIDQGKLGLDSQVPGQPFTIAHLLAHSSGLPFEAPDLVEVSPDQVGRRRIYSNLGFELLAEQVSTAVGSSFSDWVQQAVLEPLELDSVSLPGSPAFGARGNVWDVLGLASELLTPSLISPDLAEAARTVQFPGLMGVVPGYGNQKPSDWGLGYEIKGTKTPHWTPDTASPATFGHFGASGSYLLVDPDAHIVAAFLGSEPFGAIHRELWPALGQEAYAAAGR